MKKRVKYLKFTKEDIANGIEVNVKRIRCLLTGHKLRMRHNSIYGVAQMMWGQGKCSRCKEWYWVIKI